MIENLLNVFSLYCIFWLNCLCRFFLGVLIDEEFWILGVFFILIIFWIFVYIGVCWLLVISMFFLFFFFKYLGFLLFRKLLLDKERVNGNIEGIVFLFSCGCLFKLKNGYFLLKCFIILWILCIILKFLYII